MRIAAIKQPAFPQSTSIEATTIDFGCKFVEQLGAILGTVLSMLFILNYVAPDEPITGCERQVHGMASLRLHDVLYPNNLLRQLINGHSRLVICRNMVFHHCKVNDFFLKWDFSIYNSCRSQEL